MRSVSLINSTRSHSIALSNQAMMSQSTAKQCMQFLCLTLLAFLLSACGPDVPGISTDEASKLFVEDKAIMIDVREQEEWDEQHIEGVIHIPLGEVETRIAELTEYKDADIIMQCRSGKRSAIAGATLMKAGFTKVHNLEGGILAWEKDGLATIKGMPASQ